MIVFILFLLSGVSCQFFTCLDSHFKCTNGMCIPMSGRCDNYTDCIDSSDEANCGATEMLIDDLPVIIPYHSGNSPAERAVVKASNYFLSKLTDDNSWGDFTPRAAVALSFADKISPITKEEKELMKKQLNVQLTADLIQEKGETSLSTLALYINALYATCQDPRNYQGMNLVDLLRSSVDNAMKSNLTFPIVYVTLCIADEINEDKDLYNLTQMYLRNDRTGFRALAIMAMTCVARKTNRKVDNYVDHFFNENTPLIRSADIYTKALFLQAAIATGFKFHEDFIKYQLPDGSFGDMLATYNAIPALLNSSLLDLRCKTKRREGVSVGNQLKDNIGKKLIYSLWIPSDAGEETHSMVLRFEGNKTFYDVMRMAAGRDSLYSFLYDEKDEGKKVYSLAGIPNDVETGKSWILYHGSVDSVTVNWAEDMTEQKLGVDKIFPEDTDHFAFSFTRPH